MIAEIVVDLLGGAIAQQMPNLKKRGALGLRRSEHAAGVFQGLLLVLDSANLIVCSRNRQSAFMSQGLTKSFLVSSLVLSIVSSCAAQQSANNAPQQSLNSDVEVVRLRVKSLLVRVLDLTKAMDEPALRALLRLRVVTYLWSGQSEDDAKEAERVAIQTLTDLDENEGSMPAAMAKWLRSQLVAQIELHSPALAERLRKQDASTQEAARNQFDSAYSMLKDTNEIKASVDAMRRALNSGSDPGMILLFFLDQLEQKQPDQTPEFLNSILSVQEQRPDTFSLQTLMFLRDFCIRQTNPIRLQARFLTVALNAVLAASTSPDRVQLTQAYELLTSVLPAMQRLAPSLYAAALPQATAMARFNSQQPDLAEIHRRVEQSSDPVNQLISEANDGNDGKNKAIQNDLLVEAAQRALGDGRLRLAIDVVSGIEFAEQQKLEEQWRDQFLSDVIKSAISKKDLDTAKYGTSKIKSPFERASAMQEMALYFFESRDSDSANQMLNGALKLTLDSETSPAKALSLLNIVSAFTKVDDSRVVEVTQLAIKAINKIPTPDSSDKPGSNSHNEYVKTLLAVASTLMPLFESLARKDEQRALSLAGEIERREVTAAALFGASMGIIRTTKETKTSIIKK